ncbi:MAG: CPBP family intramembrane metalloprotease [Bacteroidales bacterium]|nr:CPBP family intramembrane metalloprotease [Bacteroidales bacterium]
MRIEREGIKDNVNQIVIKPVMSLNNFIGKHPVFIYFILTFVISWSGVFIRAFSTGMPASADVSAKIGPIAYLPFLLGPIITSFLLTILIEGREGLRKLINSMVKYRTGIRWYAVGLLTLPILASTTLLILSQFSNDFIPDIITGDNKVRIILTGIIVGIIGGGVMEETGWTGFAIYRLRSRYGIFTTGLIVGIVWGGWHFLPVFWGCGDGNGNLDMSLFLPGFFFHFAGLIPFRILIVWVYERTRSVFLAILMHSTLTGGLFFILNISVKGKSLFKYYLALAVLLWILVALIINVNRKKGELS